MTVETKKRPNVVELCSMYTSIVLKQMDALREREILLANKIKMLEKGRATTYTKFSNTQAININSQYGTSSPFLKNTDMGLKTGGFDYKSDFKVRKYN